MSLRRWLKSQGISGQHVAQASPVFGDPDQSAKDEKLPTGATTSLPHLVVPSHGCSSWVTLAMARTRGIHNRYCCNHFPDIFQHHKMWPAVHLMVGLTDNQDRVYASVWVLARQNPLLESRAA